MGLLESLFGGNETDQQNISKLVHTNFSLTNLLNNSLTAITNQVQQNQKEIQQIKTYLNQVQQNQKDIQHIKEYLLKKQGENDE